jgi:NAD(P)H-hydrate repair Nnr-like enzyme with NAD(P)H-hydrate epimerase domain
VGVGVAAGEGEVGGDGLVWAEGAEAGYLLECGVLFSSPSLSGRGKTYLVMLKSHGSKVMSNRLVPSGSQVSPWLFVPWVTVQPTCVDGYVHCWALV